MSSTLHLESYAQATVAQQWSSGTNTTKLNGSGSGWQIYPLLDSYFGGAGDLASVTTVAGPTSGLELLGSSGSPVQFVSAPLSADFNITGTIAFNMYGYESSMSANATFRVLVKRIRGSDGSIQETIADSSFGTELGTSSGAKNWTADATDTQFYKGDRILVIVAADDYSGGNMGAGYNVALDLAGDSYVTFSEDLTFLVEAPGTTDIVADSSALASGFNLQSNASSQRLATSFIAPEDGTINSLEIYGNKSGSPNDSLVVELQSDSGGQPSGTALASASVTGTNFPASLSWVSFDIADTTIVGGQKYWIVITRSGATDLSNYYQLKQSTHRYGGGIGASWSGSAWTVNASDTWAFKAHFTSSAVTTYPTGTASEVDPNGASYDAKEAWTSRGAGVQSSVTTTVGGWTPPLLCTVSAGGNYIEWFTKQLQAFTLGGAVLIHFRAKYDGAKVGTLRFEVAISDSDGTNPIVWASATYPGNFSSSEVPYDLWVSGKDTSVATGKRLRFRVYIDDVPDQAMLSGYHLTLYYAGAAGATGDTYLTFTQTFQASSGDASVTLSTVAITAAIPAPSPSGTAAMTLSVVNALANVLAPSASGSAAVTLNTVACVAAVYSPTIAAVQNPNVQLSTVPIVVAVQAPSVVGNANAPPNVVAVVATVNAPTVQAAAATTLPLVAAVAAVLAPQAQANAAKTLDPVAALAAIPTPTVDTTTAQDADVQLSTVAVSVAVPLPTVFAETSADVTLSLVAITVVVPSPTIEATASLTLTTVAGVTAVLSPTIVSTAAVTLTTVAIATTIPTPTADASIAITLGVVSVVSAISTPTVAADANLTLSPVLTLTAVLAPSISAQQSPSVDLITVQIVVAIPTPAVSTPGADVTVTFLDSPTNLVADGVSSSEMDLTWDTVTGASSYIIERDGVVVASGVTTQPYPDTGLDAGTQYRYRVRGVP